MAGARVQAIGKSVASFQPGWALAGLSTVVLVAIVASSNFNEIYQSQKDFVAGSLLSLAGFCFGKAISSSQEEKALAVLRGPATEALTRLERDLEAGSERVNQYYNEHCRTVAHYSAMEVLRIALDDFDKASSSAIELRTALKTGRTGPPRYVVEPTIRLSLRTIARDFHEAIGRRDQAYDWYRQRLGLEDDACWDVFAVMTADMLKGERLLSALMGASVASPPGEYLRVVAGYLHAAINRAQEFLDLTASKDIQQPKVFEVMVQDLTAAIAAVDRIQASMDRMATAEPSA